MNSERTPTVGVVIPTYNDEEFLAEAIESVLKQTYPPSQVVICDDASTDRTPDIVSQFEAQYPNILEGISQAENKGIAQNLNSGLERISQDYVSLVAGDDFWHPEKLDAEIKFLNSNPSARWAFSDSAIADKRGRRLQPTPHENDTACGWIIYEVLKRQLTIRNWIAERDLILDVGFFDEDLSVAEDWDYIIRLAATALVVHVPRETVYYRRHAANTTKFTDAIERSRCLDAVYAKHNRKINNLEISQRLNIRKLQYEDLLKGTILNALKESRKRDAVLLAMRYLSLHPSRVNRWKMLIFAAIPGFVYNKGQVFMNLLRRYIKRGGQKNYNAL